MKPFRTSSLRRTVARPESLEPRLALSTTYVDFEIVNQSDALPSDKIWIWVTGQTSTTSPAPTYPFQVDTATGIATRITDPAATAMPLVTLADLGGRPIRFDAGTTIVGGRIYLTTSPYSVVATATSSAVTTKSDATVVVQGIESGQVGAGKLTPGMLVKGTGIPDNTTITTVNSSATPTQTTATFGSGVNDFVVASSKSLSAGMLVTGPGLANLTTVESIDLGTSTVTLAAGVLTQAAETAATLSFSQSSVVLSNAATASTGINGSGAPIPVTLSFYAPAVTIGLVGGEVQVTASGSATSAASYIYDFAEFAITPVAKSSNWQLTVDTTQVDQFGLPYRLQTTPADAINAAGSGTISTVSRAAIFANYTAAMTAAELTPFLDSVVPGASAGDPPLRLLSPQDVIVQQAAENKPLQTPVDSVGSLGGSQGAWTAQLNVPVGTAGQLLTGGGQLTGTFYAFGGLLPAGTLVTAAVPSPDPATQPDTITVQTASPATTNPFSTATGQFVTIYTPPTTELNSWFGPAVGSTTNVNDGNAIDDFFAFWKARPGQLRLEVTGQSGATVYSGTVTTIQQHSSADPTGPAIDYAVLQMTGGTHGESYNIFYPYFTTNSPAAKTDPFGNAVPAPPVWMFPGDYLAGGNESPSQMVFAADGVFANSALALPGAPPTGAYTGIATALGSLENQIVTALARGYATTWQTVEDAVPGTVSADGKTVTYQLPVGTLSGGSPTATLSVGMNVSSWKIFSVPMEITAVNAAADTITVWTPATFTGSAPVEDMLLFFDMYPAGQQWSAYAKYLHNLMGYDVFIGGRSYALPYDDNGGFSTTLTSVYDPATPLTAGGTTAARATITLGNWNTRPAIDLDGDGIGDLIWHETNGEGATVAYIGWLLDAAGNTTGSRILSTSPGWELITAGTFTDGPVAGLVWREKAGGATWLWIMNADGTKAADQYLGGDADWTIVTSGDYNGDGRTDLMWRQASTGAFVAWLMDGTVKQAETVIGSDGGGTWELVATAADYDANADGVTDLIWREKASGAHVAWLLNVTSVTTVYPAFVLPGPPPGQSLVATGRFDSDGISDLVWRDPTTGGVFVGIVAYDPATNTATATPTPLIAPNPQKTVVQTIDFWLNNLVWRNIETGVYSAWQLTDGVKTGSRGVGGGPTYALVLRRPLAS